MTVPPTPPRRRLLSGIEYWELLRVLKPAVTVYVVNNLNQAVTVQIMGNMVNSTSSSVAIGTSWTVNPGTASAKTLTPDTSGWLPYIYLQLQCSTAPTSGSVSAYLLYADGSSAVLVNNLQIRDTNVHDPSTDPTAIFIAEW